MKPQTDPRPVESENAMEGLMVPGQIHWAHPTPMEREALTRFFSGDTAPGASLSVIKKGAHREVVRLQSDGVDLHIKRNQLHNFRARARRWFRPSKAQLEFDLLQKLAARGLKTLEPVAWAESANGFSILATRTLHDGFPLDKYWADTASQRSPKGRGRLLGEMANLLAAMHDLGLFHPDPHPGNLLWSPADHRLVLMDLHTVTQKKVAGLSDRIRDLASWGAWSDLRLSRGDNLLVLKRYHRALEASGLFPGFTLRALAETVRHELEKQHQRFWQKQAALSLRGGHRRFEKVKTGSFQGMALGGEKDFLRSITLLPGPGKPLPPDCSVLKESKSSRVFRIEREGKGIIVKQVPWKSTWGGWLGRMLGWDSLTRSWYWTHALRLRLLPTPRALGYGAMSRDKYSLLVMEEVAQARGLDEWARECGDRKRLLSGIRHLAKMIANLHGRGLQHRDLKAANILVDPQDRIWFVDLVGVQKAPGDKPERDQRRIRDLSRLAASFWDGKTITLGMRRLFLSAYLFGLDRIERDWKVWWRSIAREASQRRERTQARGRPLG